MNTLFGFGGFRMSCGGYIADFPENSGKIYLRTIREQWVTSDNVARHRHVGFQPEISVRLYNLKLLHSIQWRQMIDVLNQHFIFNTAITIKPRFDFVKETGLTFQCDFTGDFAPDDIAASEVGQAITLTFRSRNVIQGLPGLFSGSKVFALVDYTGASIVDHNGAQIIGTQ